MDIAVTRLKVRRRSWLRSKLTRGMNSNPSYMSWKRRTGTHIDCFLQASLTHCQCLIISIDSILQEEYQRLKVEKTSHRSTNSINNYANHKMGSNLLTDSELEVTPVSTPKEEAILAEAKMLRQHKGRLETRMQILEDHNRQLEAQLQRLRQLLESEPEPSHSPSVLTTGSLPRTSSGPHTRALHNSNISSSPITSRAIHHNHTNGSENRGLD